MHQQLHPQGYLSIPRQGYLSIWEAILASNDFPVPIIPALSPLMMMMKQPHPGGWFQIELSLRLGIFIFFSPTASVVLLPGEAPAGTKARLFCGMGLGEGRGKGEGQQ